MPPISETKETYLQVTIFKNVRLLKGEITIKIFLIKKLKICTPKKKINKRKRIMGFASKIIYN